MMSGDTRLRLGVGAAAVAAATAVAAVLPTSHQPLRAVVVAIVVGACAAAMPHIWQDVTLAALALLMVRAFLDTADGRAPWDLADSGGQVLLLTFAVFLGRGQRWMYAPSQAGRRTVDS